MKQYMNRERDVMYVLDKHQISHATIGYQYLFTAILLLVRDETLRRERAVMPLYIKVSEQFECSPESVARAMQRALNKANPKLKSGEFVFKASDQICYDAFNDERLSLHG